MDVLIAYATNSGGCFLIAEMIATALGKKHQVTVKRAAETIPGHFTKYDLIILGTPSWSVEGKEGQPHESMLALMRAADRLQFPGKLFALYGCGDRSYAFFCGAVDHLLDFVTHLGGRNLLEPLRIDGYFFDVVANDDLVKQWTVDLFKKIS